MSVPPKSFADIFNSGSWEGQQKFTDRTLLANDGTTFRIHRIVLTQRSGYFYALFDFNVHQETIVIPNIDRKILESILVYIYTGTIALDEKSACDIMIASDYLLLDDLLKLCRSFVIQNMTSTNCLPILTAVSHINRLATFDNCSRYALVHFTDILETSNGVLEELPFEILIKLLESKSLNVVSERYVWEAIISWTEANSSVRLPHVPELLTCLRLQEEIDEELVAEILSHTIVSNNPHIFSLILSNASNFYRIKCTVLSHHESFESLYQNAPCSYDPRMTNRLHLIARNATWGSELFITYDNEFDFWRQVGEAHFSIVKMVQMGQCIFVFNKEKNTNGIYDIVEGSWLEEELPPIPGHRGWTITLGEKLYRIGKDFASWDMISIYEFQRNSWEIKTTVRDILVYGAVPLKDQIFTVGCVEEDEVMICQAYDPDKNTWISHPAPNIFRYDFFVTAYHEQVFVIPNYRDPHRKTVEVYDPHQNTWISLPDLPFHYLYPEAVVVDDKMVVYETNEYNRRYQKVDPPVYWDESAHIWRIIDKSSPWFHIERYSFLILDDCRVVKDLTAENRRRGNEWERIHPV
ncbi:Kelch-like protein 25 [Araneus ventricosus]|uniref:Kelch-like protein 25 n=1 Tax=Araneus ventricosus TaxID=182803 RepID=A0A4Y2FZ61_ARAVE|nr:Kelch-like protein 25 [Araneus ventricosus]